MHVVSEPILSMPFLLADILIKMINGNNIQLLEYPIPTAARPSQKPSHGDILGTKRGIIDPLLSKRPEKILNKKIE